MWQRLKFLLLALFPSYVDHVVHFDTVTDCITPIYKRRCFCFVQNRDVPRNGYFLFRLWNRRHMSFSHVILSAWHVQKALELDDTKCLLSIPGKHLSETLSNYVQQGSQCRSHTIMEILVDGKDQYMMFYPFLRSCYIKQNVTTHMLNLLFTWISGEAHQSRNISVSDFEYVPYTRTYNEFLFY